MDDQKQARRDWAVRTIVEQFEAADSDIGNAIFAIEQELSQLPDRVAAHREGRVNPNVVELPPSVMLYQAADVWKRQVGKRVHVGANMRLLAPDLNEAVTVASRAVSACLLGSNTYIAPDDKVGLSKLADDLLVAKAEQAAARNALRSWLGLPTID